MVSNYVANSKTTARWCDRCGTLVLGNACGCGSEIRSFQINSPGDVRPAMGKGRDLVLALLKENFGTDGGLSDKAIFLNKIPGEDRSDEVIAHGEVIAVIRFEVELNRFSLELRQAGAELLKDMATTNVVVFGNMSGHLKGKSVPGANIREIKGDFEEGAPLLLIKGGKVGPGTAYVSSKEMRDAEKAFRIKDLNSLTNMPLSPDSDRKRFISANLAHLRSIESSAASDIRSFIKDKKQPVTSSFSGGKDSLAALGVLMKVKKDPELLFVDTGLEFPETVAYVDDFVKKHRLRLHRAEAGDAFCQYTIGNTYFWWDFVDIDGRTPETFPNRADFFAALSLLRSFETAVHKSHSEYTSATHHSFMPEGFVFAPLRISLLTRSGYFSAKSMAMLPPSLKPRMCAF